MGYFSNLGVVMPMLQPNHRYIDDAILPWLDLHFPEDSAYYGRVFIGHRPCYENAGLYNLSRRNIDELKAFVSEMHISRRLDYYITANSFSGVQRNKDSVFALHNIVVDIDCHSEDVEETPAELAQAFVWQCSRDLWTTGEMPEPNSVVMTGRGVQLWWAINPISVKLEWIYRRIQSWIIDGLDALIKENAGRLKGLSIDRKASGNLAGWFRLPLTRNTKASRWGTLQLRRTERYSHQDLLDIVPSDYRPATEQSRETVGEQMSYLPLAAYDREVLEQGTSIMARRVWQLVRLRALRNAPIGSEQRDLLCFFVYCALLADYGPDEAWGRLLAFNAGFKEPYTESVLSQKMSHASIKQYKVSNAKLIEYLEITEAEQDAIGLYPAGTVKKKTTGKRSRSNYTRDLIRRTGREDRDMKILSLFFGGRSKAAIARELGISRNTVIKVIGEEIAAQEAARASVQDNANRAMLAKAAGAEGAENFATPEKGLLKNGALIYVSYGYPIEDAGSSYAITDIPDPSGGSG